MHTFSTKHMSSSTCNRLWFLEHPQGYVLGVGDIYDMFVILKTKTQKNPPFDTFLLPFELPKFAYI